MGNIVYGSRLAPDGEHLEADPGEQAALAEIWRLRSAGATLRGIAAALNHRAYRTRRGTAWRLESVARVLKRATRYNAQRPTEGTLSFLPEQAAAIRAQVVERTTRSGEMR